VLGVDLIVIVVLLAVAPWPASASARGARLWTCSEGRDDVGDHRSDAGLVALAGVTMALPGCRAARHDRLAR
jgi:hypothetical protein